MQRFEDANKIDTAFAKRHIAELSGAMFGNGLSVFQVDGGDTVDAEPLREVLSSWVQIKDLEHLQDGANHKLQVKINEMASALEDDYEVCFELITTSTLTESAQNDLAAFQ